MVEGVDYVIGNHDKMNFLDYLGEQKPASPVVIRERIDRSDFSMGHVEKFILNSEPILRFRMGVILCALFV